MSVRKKKEYSHVSKHGCHLLARAAPRKQHMLGCVSVHSPRLGCETFHCACYSESPNNRLSYSRSYIATLASFASMYACMRCGFPAKTIDRGHSDLNYLASCIIFFPTSHDIFLPNTSTSYHDLNATSSSSLLANHILTFFSKGQQKLCRYFY
jgi:hypothetical protein